MSDRYAPTAMPRERILLMGPFDAGKTHAALDAVMHTLPDDGRLWAIDSDNAMLRNLAHADLGLDMGRVERVVPAGWSEYRTFTKTAVAKAGPDDWLVVDRLETAWSAVAEWYVHAVHGEDMEDYLLRLRAERAKRGKDSPVPLGQAVDYQVVNPAYQKWMRAQLVEFPGHVLWVSGVKDLNTAESTWADSPQVRKRFGAVGVKPAGQKDTGHVPHTVLHLDVNFDGVRQVTTIKDRGGRRRLDHVTCNSFTRTYLVSVAGWRPARNDNEDQE